MSESNQHSSADEFLLVRNGLKPRASVGTRNEAMLASIRLEEQNETLRDILRGFLYDADMGDLPGIGQRDKARAVLFPAKRPSA